MSKKNASVLVVAMSVLAMAGPTNAALVDLPKTKSPLDRLELGLLILGLQSFSLRCFQIDACLPEPQAELVVPEIWPQQREHFEAKIPAHRPVPIPRPAVRPATPNEEPKKVSLFSAPKALKPLLDRVPDDVPTLAPMAHTMFCLRYPGDCKVRKVSFRGRPFQLTDKRRAELAEVNARVNRGIRWQRNAVGLAGEKWIVNPSTGDCNDYAVSKRHELLARGWPSRALLLAEVVTTWGEHHLVLVVRTGEGDLILDNMTRTIKPWSKAPYRWVRIQSPRNPKFWFKVGDRMKTATRL